jgi:hypothetical protein
MSQYRNTENSAFDLQCFEHYSLYINCTNKSSKVSQPVLGIAITGFEVIALNKKRVFLNLISTF